MYYSLTLLSNTILKYNHGLICLVLFFSNHDKQHEF